MKNIGKAILEVMAAVQVVHKNKTVGSGVNAYQGVADEDVKRAIGDAMEKAGLCLVPTKVDAKINIDRWEENGKSKQSVMTEVFTEYLLLHAPSGETITLAGYGHGQDPQDKAAGKATTYALKNTLLYTFLVPTSKIDDTDTEHSNDKPVPPSGSQSTLPWLTQEQFDAMKKAISEGKKDYVKTSMAKYRMKKEYRDGLEALLK